jgi:hypothetical protein
MSKRVGSAAQGARPVVLVLDEFPYLARENPGLPSIVQALYDRIGPGSPAAAAPLRGAVRRRPLGDLPDGLLQRR